MFRLIPRFFILVGLLVLVLALGAGLASSASPALKLCPDPVAPGGTVSVQGSGFAPGAVNLTLDLSAFGLSAATAVGTATAGADGSFLYPLSILNKISFLSLPLALGRGYKSSPPRV